MRVWVGSSGFAYDFWKGGFYPPDIDAVDMLEFYASRFDAVEINNTFYRMPKTEVVQRWADCTPDDFRFVIKASRRITHMARLEECEDSVEYLYSRLLPLGPKLGAVLFQLPPYLRKGVDRLRSFVACLPEGSRAAVEFRHDSWFCDEVYDVLRERGIAMCIGDYEGKNAEVVEGGQTPKVATAPFGYLRLRDEAYDDDALRGWVEEMSARWEETFVFFKHEENAPELIDRMRRVLET